MSVEQALRGAWQRVWSNPVLWVGGFVVAAVISSATVGLLLGPLVIGLLRALDREEEGAPPSGIEVWFQGFDAFGPALVVSVLCWVAFMMGAAMCFVPGLLFLPLPLPALWWVARGEADPLRALQNAWSGIARDWSGAVGLHTVLLFVGASGYLLLGFGEVVTLPLAFAAAVGQARALVGPPGPGGSPRPPSPPPPLRPTPTPSQPSPQVGGWFGGRGPFSHPTPPSPLPGAGPMGPEIK